MLMPSLKIVALLAAIAAPADEVEGPIYKSWASHEPGTAITIQTVTEAKGRTVETTMTDRLVSVDARKVVVERTIRSESDGAMSEIAPQEFEYQRMFPLLPGVKAEDVGKPKGVIASGTETIEVAGEDYEADWYETAGTTEAGPSKTKTWVSDDMPGKLLKSVSEVPATGKTTTIEVIELRVP